MRDNELTISATGGRGLEDGFYGNLNERESVVPGTAESGWCNCTEPNLNLAEKLMFVRCLCTQPSAHLQTPLLIAHCKRFVTAAGDHALLSKGTLAVLNM